MKKLTTVLLAGVAMLALSQAFAQTPPAAHPAPAQSTAPAAPVKDYVILKVNGQDIKKSEVEQVFKTMFGGALGGAAMPTFDTFDENLRRNVLRGVVSERLLAAEAEKSGIDKREDVQQKLKMARDQVLIQTFVQEKTKAEVTDAALKAEYEKQMQAANTQEEVRARHILVKTEAEANAIHQQVSKGTPFDKIAKEKSQDKGSGAQGGELGWFTADKMVPEFSKAAFALKKGEISKPVKSDFGWHIIQVEDRRKVSPPPFDQVKEQLRQQQSNKIMETYVLGLIAKANVKYYGTDGKEQDLMKDDKVPAPTAPTSTPIPAPKPSEPKK